MFLYIVHLGICYAFRDGNCDREDCRFAHEEGGSGGGGGRGGGI